MPNGAAGTEVLRKNLEREKNGIRHGDVKGYRKSKELKEFMSDLPYRQFKVQLPLPKKDIRPNEATKKSKKEIMAEKLKKARESKKEQSGSK